jgi:hypothetical protein
MSTFDYCNTNTIDVRISQTLDKQQCKLAFVLEQATAPFGSSSAPFNLPLFAKSARRDSW